MTSVAIRRAQRTRDFRHLSELLVEYEAALPSELRHGTVPPPAELERCYARENAAFVASGDGVDIGCVAVKRLTNETAMMLRLFVRPEHRGVGAARALVQRALDFVREVGYARVVLDTDKTSLNAAYQLYRSLGFTECAPYRAAPYDCATFMEYRLDGGAVEA